MTTILWNDTPAGMFTQRACLHPLSKIVKEVRANIAGKDLGCLDPEACESPRKQGDFSVDLARGPCEDHLPLIPAVRMLIATKTFFMAFAGSEKGRGVHAGDFRWTTSGGPVIVDGQMQGLNNIDIGAVSASTNCVQAGVLEGRLHGKIVSGGHVGGEITALYRLHFELILDHGGLETLRIKDGTIEGVAIVPCGKTTAG